MYTPCIPYIYSFRDGPIHFLRLNENNFVWIFIFYLVTCWNLASLKGESSLASLWLKIAITEKKKTFSLFSGEWIIIRRSLSNGYGTTLTSSLRLFNGREIYLRLIMMMLCPTWIVRVGAIQWFWFLLCLHERLIIKSTRKYRRNSCSYISGKEWRKLNRWGLFSLLPFSCVVLHLFLSSQQPKRKKKAENNNDESMCAHPIHQRTDNTHTANV